MTATTAKPVKPIGTTQDEIIARGLEAHEDAFENVAGDLEDMGTDIASEIRDMITGSKMPLSKLKQLRANVASLAADLEGASDELKAVIAEAEAYEPAVLKCSVCDAFAMYMAPKRVVVGKVTWVPICEDHAKGWWEGADWVGKMYKIGEGIVEP